MAFDALGGGAGAASGAAIGTAFAPGIGTGIGAILGGLAGGFFGGGKKSPSVDISAELAKIRALYDEQRASLKADAKERLAGANKLTASNLAGRGIYSSPVSELSFGENQRASESDLVRALAALAGGQAGTESQLTSLLSQQSYQSQLAQAEQEQQKKNTLLALLGGAAGGFGAKVPGGNSVKGQSVLGGNASLFGAGGNFSNQNQALLSYLGQNQQPLFLSNPNSGYASPKNFGF